MAIMAHRLFQKRGIKLIRINGKIVTNAIKVKNSRPA